MRSKKLATCMLCMSMLSLLATGCGKVSQPVENIEAYLSPVSEISVPDDVKIIGLGEAAHGCKEFQTLKLEVFQSLLANNDCHIFAIEGDFGGCQIVNDYIHGADISAEKAISEIGFAIYRTQEMVDAIQWMRSYNETASKDDQISFYGFDMQRIDNNKDLLLTYLNQVDPDEASQIESHLSSITDDNAYSLDKGTNQTIVMDVEKLLTTMGNNKSAYIADSDEKSYQIAYMAAECIMQDATLHVGDVNYNVARDTYMAEKVTEIYELEQEQKLFINGHNGHISRVSLNPTYKCMGSMLSEQYQEAYFAIGTDFASGSVNVKNTAGNDFVVTVKNNENLIGQIANLPENIYYMDLANASENEALHTILHTTIPMLTLDATFNTWQKPLKFTYVLNTTPATAYNGVILVKNTTATEHFGLL